MSDDGELLELNTSKKHIEPEPEIEVKKPKKTYLPGEKLLKKLSNTKTKSNKISRIKNAIRRDVEHLYPDSDTLF